VISKSMRLFLNKKLYRVTFDQAFDVVIQCCRTTKRHGQHGTWISDKIISAYTELHLMGFAHSVEVWNEDKIVGGLYGVSIGNCFFGESMFSHQPNASKTALITLAQVLETKNFALMDCQMPTEHLFSMGAKEISRKDFLSIVEESHQYETHLNNWGAWCD
jgi:leucyl/phenylalanyl-tRNA---protein transferase